MNLKVSLRFLVFAALTLVCWGGLVSGLRAEKPVYAPVPAEEFKMREGIPNFIRKLEAKEPVTVVYFGGSITAMGGWRTQTTEWFQKEFPDSPLTSVNAAIGGTGSDLGVFRNTDDVISHNPDLVFVEFAVNDGGTRPEEIWRSMEGIVRQIWKANPATDIVFVYTFRVGNENDTEKGYYVQSAGAMEMLADFYGIPSINFNIPVVALEKEGKLIYQAENPVEGKILFSTDGVHPREEGHEIYTAAVRQYVLAMKEASEKKSVPSCDDIQAKRGEYLKGAFVENNDEQAKMVAVDPSFLKGDDWNIDKGELGQIFADRMETLWDSNKPGDAIEFKFKGTEASLYVLLGPNGGQMMVTLDGETTGPHPLFDSYCTYHRLAALRIGENLDPNVIHSVRVEIHPEQPDRHPALKDVENAEELIQTPRYQGYHLWIGKIMLIGDIVK